jgi:Sulfotransferase domain
LITLVSNFASRVKVEYKRRKTDAFIVSFPKCGRTWLRVLIGKAICEKFNFPDEFLIKTYEVTSKSGLLRTQLTHDHSAIIEGYRYQELPTDKSEYKNKKVVFLTRNIKDVLVSCYFQATKRVGGYSGNISDFIRNDKFGVMKIITFYNVWHENMSTPKDFLLIRYEDMHENPKKVLSATLSFLGLDVVEDDIITNAVEFARFNNMRKLEKIDFFNRSSMRPGNDTDEESYKVRRGVMGGYNSYLSSDDIEFIDQVIKETGCPFYPA